jgi:hypothetical protein
LQIWHEILRSSCILVESRVIFQIACAQEYKEGKLMHTYPLKAPKLAAISAALSSEGSERQAARASGSGKKAAQARVVTPLGEVVYKGHSAYDLSAQLQLGIR